MSDITKVGMLSAEDSDQLVANHVPIGPNDVTGIVLYFLTGVLDQETFFA